jgi:hypothetical protein
MQAIEHIPPRSKRGIEGYIIWAEACSGRADRLNQKRKSVRELAFPPQERLHSKYGRTSRVWAADVCFAESDPGGR